MSPPQDASLEDQPDGRMLTSLAEIPVQRVNKIGDKRAEALAAVEISNVLDLITHYPRR